MCIVMKNNDEDKNADLKVFEERKNDETLSLEVFIQELKADGKL